MPHVPNRDTITVEAPLEDVDAQWTQFEEFPRFIDGVNRVVQIDDRTLEWTATVAGREKRWTARIVDQTPDVRIAWRSLDGAQNDRAVLFSWVDGGTTDVRLVVDADPEGIVEDAGDRLGLLRPTHRQLEVLRANTAAGSIAAGSIAAAAYELGISETTARQHVSGLYRRTGCLYVTQAPYHLGVAEGIRPIEERPRLGVGRVSSPTTPRVGHVPH